MRITCAWCMKDTRGKVDRYCNRNFCKGADCMSQFQRFVDNHNRLELRLETVAPATVPSYGPWTGEPFDE